MSTLARALSPSAPTATLVTVPVRGQTLGWVLLAMLAGSLAITLSAQVSIGLPVGPVPLTGQTLGVLLVGAALGSRLGAATVILYVAEGLAGLPVFANGASGWAYFTGPTGGYLVGFVPAAFLVGLLAEHGWDRSVPRTVAAMVLNNLAIYLVGAAHLQSLVGWSPAWSGGVEPFLPGDAIKILVAAGVLPGAWWLRRRFLGEP